MAFPSLVGGTLVPEDFAPSILFAILFGCLVPLAAFRLVAKGSRTTLLIGTVAFSVERVVIFSIRAVQSRNRAMADSHSLATYEQLTIGMGYIGICQDLVNFLRVLLVNRTRPLDDNETEKRESADRPRARFWRRRLADFLGVAFVAAIAPGVISGSRYARGIDQADVASQVMTLRYASTGVALLLTATIGVVALAAALRRGAGAHKDPAALLAALAALLSVVAVYRLCVMHHTTDALLSRGPGSLSSPGAKAAFYVFHMLPEWLASAVLLGANARQVFSTGPFGDWQAVDGETTCGRRRRDDVRAQEAGAEGAAGGQGCARCRRGLAVCVGVMS